MQPFKLNSPYKPAGDQVEAILTLSNSINKKEKFQTLLGVRAYNKKHNITPTTTIRELDKNLKTDEKEKSFRRDKIDKMPKKERQKLLKELKAKMLASAKRLDFEEAMRLRDEISKIKKL